MFKSLKQKRKYFIWPPVIFFIFVAIVYAGYNIAEQKYPEPQQSVRFGVTFSTKYTEELGLEWKHVFDMTIDDLGVRYFRIPIYWSEIEPHPGQYNFTAYDYIMTRAEQVGARIIPVIGRRQPRWPECHVPIWAYGNSEAVQRINILSSIEATIEHYKDSPAIIAWQVENEPLLSIFGDCPKPNLTLLADEVALVKKLDPSRPVMLTESGELSTWIRLTPYADWIGASMYRITWNESFGYWVYPLTPKHYMRKAQLIAPLVDKVMVSELQAEPWFTRHIHSLPLEEQYHSMNPEVLRKNIRFVTQARFDEVLLWGVEWWYWLKYKKDEPGMWEAAREVFNN